MLKVLTANVESISQAIDEIIALSNVENFDVIGLNETWLSTQLDKQMPAEVPIHRYKVGLLCVQTNPNRTRMWINQVCLKYVEPNR